EAEDPTAATIDETKERLHRCPICFKVIGCKNSVLLHLRTHSPDKPFKCDKCGNAYSGKENLVSHVRICEEKQGTPKFFCEICGNRFYCSKTLSAHKGGCVSTARKLNLKRPQREASAGPQLLAYECHVCHQKFNLKKEMEAHMFIHEDAMPYKCNKCGNQYRRRDYLITHRRTCLQMSSDPEYRCGFCSNRFYKEIFWKRHERQCKVNPGKPLMETYECHICNKVFRYNSDLQRHIDTHNTTRSYACV
uniref:Putative zn finger n=1 Tax=Lutzomyia longipalpis TaxID=7200 RepID=A0A1B0CDT0_LUTLO